MKPRFLLLMRHAKHSKGRIKGSPDGPTALDGIASALQKLVKSAESSWGPIPSEQFEFSASATNAVLTDDGRYETLAVAKRLKDFMAEGTEEPTVEVAAVRYFASPEAKETAEAFCKGYALPASDGLFDVIEILGPATRSADVAKAGEDSLWERVRYEAKTALDRAQEDARPETGFKGNAVLIVGHQPAIGWLANAILGHAVPAAQSELLCLDFENERRPVLRWVISPSEGTSSEELKEKIKSKMTLANLLSGFITAGIGVLVSMLAEGAKVAALGVQAAVAFGAAALLGVAVAFYLSTMFSYDRLLMPARFWAETAHAAGKNRPSWLVARPPSGIHWVLYQNMLRVWQRQFVPATVLTLCGLFLLWSAVFWSTWDFSHSTDWCQTVLSRTLSLAPLVVVCVFAICLRRTAVGQSLMRKIRRSIGPWLGSED